MLAFFLHASVVARACEMVGVDDGSPLSITTSPEHPFFAGPLSMLPIAFAVIGPELNFYETPIQNRLSANVDVTVFSVSAMYDPTALEVFGRENVSTARRRCDPVGGPSSDKMKKYQTVANGLTFSYAYWLNMPPSRQAITDFMIGLGFEDVWAEMLRADFDGCNETNLKTPWGLGKCFADEYFEYFSTDGWNQDGSLANEYNRQSYADFNFVDAEGDVYQKYEPSRRWAHWQPLEESDNRGYFSKQQHVTPFIGATAKLLAINATDECRFLRRRRAPRDRLNYNEAAEFVLDSTLAMASNETTQMLIEYFDSKLNSLTALMTQWAIANQYSEMEYWQVTTGAALTLLDSTVVVWREKVRHNRVRPTNVVHRAKQGELVHTYGGPGQGPQWIPGEDWHPYIRTMPHAEYPSGSSCFCLAWSEYMILEAQTDTVTPPFAVPFPSGSSKIMPGTVPSSDLTVDFTKWSDISAACSVSRTDGGMHFASSIPAGEDLCSGISAQVFAHMAKLVAGDPDGAIADFSDSAVDVCEL